MKKRVRSLSRLGFCPACRRTTGLETSPGPRRRCALVAFGAGY
jgi:hypothetical protein